MARSSADDVELKRACEASIEGSRHNIVLSIRVAKSRGIFGKSAKLGRQMAKARVIAITTKSKGQKTKAFLRVLKYSNGGLLEPTKLYKLKHLSKVEVIQNDPSGCTFMLVFTYVMGFGEADVFSERMKHELQALEAANIHALLESEAIIKEVLHGLEVAIICVEDMDEWLGIFNAKLKHMREDIELIEARNNKLELHSANHKELEEELDKLVGWLHIPPQLATCLMVGSFDEPRVMKNIEACEWLIGAIRHLQVPILDPSYANLQAVKEKRVELEKLKSTFVWRASEFLRNYFASLVDFMINDKTYFSRRGSLKRPNHAELRYKCRTYAQLLQHLKAREFANELRASTKVGKAPTVWFESSAGSGQTANSEETGVLSEAYSKMLTVFIPLLVDESTFFAHFMCFDVPKLANSSNSGSDGNGETDDDQEGIASGSSTTELSFLNESLQELLDGIQEDFYSLLDWAFKFDPLRCISMHGITERYLSGQKVDTAGFVRLLLDDLETRISMNFGRFVDDCIYMIEKTERNARQLGVLSYIPRFAFLATRMEQYIQGQSRDLVDQTYTKIVSIMFVCLERTAQMEPKYSDIVLLENYAAFQNSLYDLANVVPTLAKFYRQASESYDQACTRHINMIIFITFERLFIFARRMEELMVTITPQEIQFQVGMSKADLRKMLKSSLSGLDKTINAMYKKLQKNLTSEELLPSLWEKCKKDFLDKYGSFVKLVNQIYPGENVPPASEMRELLAQM
ncbi:hypothetical protein KFK09_008151 [Dendrobium nobile]|uniref:Exocyst complex component Sec3 PIP2-binding N-terminal domain-containing protein n=1 Tax=Dendrobium nobile TaxID=94219 RepID=A0A8T3BYW7_DENNO|nr:hypothetical protein KFK09_008151 [Dendrobium nobile]